MLEKKNEERNQVELICMEEIVPKDHLLRKIEYAVDFMKIYEMVEDLYCADNGRPSVDPVVLFKIVIIQHIYGIPSLRRTASEIEMNLAYRWFLGYGINEKTPHFATVSYNFKHRFSEELIEEIFNWILSKINGADIFHPKRYS